MAPETESGTGSAQTTTDREQIRQWAESRGGRPSCVRGTGGGNDVGMLRINFPGYSGEDTLQEIEWDEWFRAFDENNLAFLYQDRTSDGSESRFFKLINRDSAGESGGGQRLWGHHDFLLRVPGARAKVAVRRWPEWWRLQLPAVRS